MKGHCGFNLTTMAPPPSNYQMSSIVVAATTAADDAREGQPTRSSTAWGEGGGEDATFSVAVAAATAKDRMGGRGGHN
jgi:hypothetical protein